MDSGLCDRCAEVVHGELATVYTQHGDEMWCERCCDNYTVVCDRCGDVYEEEWGQIDNDGVCLCCDGVCLCCRIDRAEPDYDCKHEENKNRDN